MQDIISLNNIYPYFVLIFVDAIIHTVSQQACRIKKHLLLKQRYLNEEMFTFRKKNDDFIHCHHCLGTIF